MRLPKSCQLSVEEVCFDGLIRPRFFLGVSVESKEVGICMTRYILGHPFLLELRLWWATRQCLRMLEKFARFNT